MPRTATLAQFEIVLTGRYSEYEEQLCGSKLENQYQYVARKSITAKFDFDFFCGLNNNSKLCLNFEWYLP